MQAATDRVATKEKGEVRRVQQRELKSALYYKALMAVRMGPNTTWFTVGYKTLVGRGGVLTTPELRLALKEWANEKNYGANMKKGDLVVDFKSKYHHLIVSVIVVAYVQWTM